MSTTDILFNSPALHSLKRNQLVQLCKRHNVKATGKNTDIIERLKRHARTLPSDALDENTSDVEEDEDHQDSDTRDARHRPSELWEVVMDDIPEESNSMGTYSSTKSMQSIGPNGEFGTGMSKSTSVTSSIKALASSLGLKRSAASHTAAESSTAGGKASLRSNLSRNNASLNPNARDSLTAHAIPYSSIPPSPMPHTDAFTLRSGDMDTSLSSIDRPIPGVAGREGVEAAAGSSTIRLITAPFTPAAPSPPRLRPYEPAFDLVPPTPGNTNAVPRWPLSPEVQRVEKIYPSLSFEPTVITEGDVAMPGGLTATSSRPIRTPHKRLSAKTAHGAMSMLSPPRAAGEAFIFGSPNPRHSISNAEFKSAASSVLAEMNARLGLTGTKAVGIDLIAGRQPGDAQDKNGVLHHQFGGRGGAGHDGKPDGGIRFEKAHEEEFSKMESIASHYAAKRGSPAKPAADGAPAPVLLAKKRKSSVLGNGRPGALKVRRSSAIVISAGARKRMALPGGFGDDDDDDDNNEDQQEGDGDRRTSKRPRVSQVPQPRAETTKRVSIAPLPAKGGASSAMDTGESASASEEAQKEKEREAIKRKLEFNKAKRRSSMGRVSVGGGKAPLIPNQKAKASTSRFGFLSSAKSLVKSVWNRGAGAPAASTSTTSAIPVPKSGSLPATKPPIPDRKPPRHLLSKASLSQPEAAAPQQGKAKKPSLAPAYSRPSTSAVIAGRGVIQRAVSGDSTKMHKPTASGSTAGAGMRVTSNGSTVSRSRSPLPSFGGVGDSVKSSAARGSIGAKGASRPLPKPPTPLSSMGGRVSAVHAGVSSLGTRNSVASTGSVARKRESTLLAPTASSLARMQSAVRPPAASASTSAVFVRAPRAGQGATAAAAALEPITNTPVKETAGARCNLSSPSKIPVSMMSPRPRPPAIFSRPLELAPQADGESIVNAITGIVSPKKPTVAETAPVREKGAIGRGGSMQRKPRISRSKVIAKLGAQRAASAASSSTSASARKSIGAVRSGLAPKGKTRSSVGAAQARRSFGGVKAAGGRASGVDGVLMSAKKRARQSEYIRRRSARGVLGGGDGEGMDVDD